MDSTGEFKILSLCTGYGGLELGLHAVLGSIGVVAVEIEAFAATNLVAKAEEGKMAIEALYPDCRSLPYRRFRGCFDGITAGFPCQPFSTAGLRKGTEDDRHLWPVIEEAIDAVRPDFVFLENVPGIVTTKTIDHRPKLKEYCKGAAQRLGTEWGVHFAGKLAGFGGVSVLRYVLHRLERLGYKCEPGMFTAEEVGAPHKRQRVFILAIAPDPDGRAGIERIKEASRCRRDRFANDCCELANSSSNSGAIHKGQRRQRCGAVNAGGSGESELANTNIGQSGPAIIAEPVKTKQPESGDDGGNAKLANADEAGRLKQSGAQPVQQEHATVEYGGDRYPARPGQSQYDWEEPRTFESGMGRTIDGFESGVDELRLLGNGVTPEQAEKAFRELLQRFG